MNCPNCGYLNAEGATVCASCGQTLVAAPAEPMYAPPAAPAAPAAPPAYAPPAPQAYAPQPGYAPPAQGFAPPQVVATAPVKNHMVMAILTTLFCCLPAGVVAIIYASQVNSKLQAGDFMGAQAASKNAATWSWVSVGLGALYIVGIIIYVVAMGVLAAGSGSY